MFQVLENITLEELNEFVYPAGFGKPFHRVVRVGQFHKVEVKGTEDETVWKFKYVLLQTIER